MARDWPVGSVPAMSLSSKSIGRTDAHVVGEGSRTVSTQKQLRGRCWQEPLRPSPRLAPAQWRWCGHCEWLSISAQGAYASSQRVACPGRFATAAAFRRSAELTTPTAATKLALKSIATRYQHLAAEIEALDKHLDQLVAVAAPALVAIKGVGTDIASTLLTIAGDNPERLASEGAFAHLVGVAPIEASSGKITRYRLNRGGDRQGNRALYLLAVGRMGWDPATKAYVARRTAEGRTKPEIIRCLKRYIARELYPVLLVMTPEARPGRSPKSSLQTA